MGAPWSAPDGPWHGEGIAVVGMAGRFPGARTVAELWDRLSEGRDCITRFTEEELRAEGVDEGTLRHERFVPASAVLDDIDRFDADLFRISPREAESMDPQQRILLEVAQEALDDAGLDPAGRDRIGVYAGGRLSGYWLRLLLDHQFMNTMGWHQVAAGNDKDFIASQISFRFDLRGPSVDVQAACSTSLLAVALAADALIAGHCDVALAGGVSIAVPHRVGYLYQPGGIASPDGVCRPFDAGANGSVLGNGAGLVVLKTVERAIRDRDRIHAVIRSTAVNNDGRSKSSFAAPSVDGQADVIEAALRHSGVTPADVQYVETHGTGTILGDPIELTALARARDAAGPRAEPCTIGSVKGNVGHLDPAAGIVSLVKVALALTHRKIPPSIHFERPNPAVDLTVLGLRVPTALEPWETDGRPRRAGVSSFGIGGTNVHAVIEQAPAVPERVPDGMAEPIEELLLLSAASDAALDEAAARVAGHLCVSTGTPLADVAYTLGSRRVFDRRRFAVARTHDEAARALRVPTGAEPAAPPDREVCLLFPGQGSQRVGAGRELYRTEPVFRRAFDEVADLCVEHLDIDLRTWVDGDGGDGGGDGEVQRTVVAQPLLFALEHAGARLWRHWGIEPAAALGHSVGELVAGWLCGVLSLPDAVRVVCARGRLMQAAEPGAMLAVGLDEAAAGALEDDDVRVSALNGPRQQTLSGSVEGVAQLEQRLTAEGVTWHRLRTSHAFHHPSMATAAAELERVLDGIELREPERPFVSTVSGTWIRPEQAIDPAFWASGITEPVRFSAAARELLADPDRVLVECGPGTALVSLVRSHLDGAAVVVVPTMAPPGDGSDRAAALRALGRVWQSGAPVDRAAVWAGREARKATLPGYAFQRRRFWIDGPAAPAGRPPSPNGHGPSPVPPPPYPVPAPAFAPAPQAPAPPGSAFAPGLQAPAPQASPGLPGPVCVPTWRPGEPPPAGAAEPACWLLLADGLGLAAALGERLAAAGGDVVAAVPGPGFGSLGGAAFVLDPASTDDLHRLADAVGDRGRPVRIVNAWTTLPPDGPLTARRGRDGVLLGFRAPATLLQALARAGRPAASVHTITTQLFDVTGGEAIDPTFAPALGIVRVLGQESGSVARLVDVARPSGPDEARRLVDLLAAELLSSAPEPVVAHRGPARLIEAYADVPMPPPDAMLARIRPGGTYVVTGGFGGIGGVLARALAAIGRPRLVLVGRRGAGGDDTRTARARALVAELEARGATVAAVAADVSDPTQAQALLTEVGARFGPVAGLVHAAGVPGGGLLLTRDLYAADAVFAAKVQGTIALLSALTAHGPDFVALCASFAGVGGGVGQGDYAGANAALDALARYGRAAGLPVTSIDWPAWRDVGMAADMTLPPELAAAKEASLAAGITPEEGVALFGSLLASGHPQLVVVPRAAAPTPATTAPATAPAAARPAAPPTILSTIALGGEPSPNGLRVADGELLPVLEQRLRDIWSAVLGVDVGGDEQQDFFKLGGQSLMGLQIVTRIGEEFPVPLDLDDLLQHPTVPALAALVHGRLVESVATMPDDRVRALLASGGR